MKTNCQIAKVDEMFMFLTVSLLFGIRFSLNDFIYSARAAPTEMTCNGGTLPNIIDSDMFTAFDCNVPDSTEGTTIKLMGRSPPDNTSPLAQICLVGGIVPPTSKLVVRGGASAADIAAPTNLTIFNFIFDESLLDISNLFAPGTLITVTHCEFSRKKSHPHTAVATTAGYLIVLSGLTLPTEGQMSFTANLFKSLIDGAPMVFALFGDVNLENTLFEVRNNSVTLMNANQNNNAYFVYVASFIFALTSNSRFEWTLNHVESFCQSTFLNFAATLNVATVLVHGNYFMYGVGTHYGDSMSSVSLLLTFESDGSDFVALTSNIFNYVGVIWQSATGGIVMLTPQTDNGGSFYIADNTFYDSTPVDCLVATVFLNFAAAGSVRLVLAANNFFRRTSAAKPFVDLVAGSISNADTTSLMIADNVFSAEEIPARALIGGILPTAKGSIILCNNLWYGEFIVDSSATDESVPMIGVLAGVIVFCSMPTPLLTSLTSTMMTTTATTTDLITTTTTSTFTLSSTLTPTSAATTITDTSSMSSTQATTLSSMTPSFSTPSSFDSTTIQMLSTTTGSTTDQILSTLTSTSESTTTPTTLTIPPTTVLTSSTTPTPIAPGVRPTTKPSKKSENKETSSKTGIIIAVLIGVVVFVCLVTYLVLMHIRRRRNSRKHQGFDMSENASFVHAQLLLEMQGSPTTKDPEVKTKLFERRS